MLLPPDVCFDGLTRKLLLPDPLLMLRRRPHHQCESCCSINQLSPDDLPLQPAAACCADICCCNDKAVAARIICQYCWTSTSVTKLVLL
jgi:hypothetical protein